MNTLTVILVIIAFIGWGAGAFLAKLAANRIGEQSVFWDLLGYIPAILIYSLLTFKFKNIISQFHAEKTGVVLAIISGLIGSMAAISFYYLMTRSEASIVTPLTALYPALTVVLGIIFLHEGITAAKVAGIFFSLLAIWLLTR